MRPKIAIPRMFASTRRSYLSVYLVIDHSSNVDPRDVVEVILDAGQFQDEINEMNEEGHRIEVISATV